MRGIVTAAFFLIWVWKLLFCEFIIQQKKCITYRHRQPDAWKVCCRHGQPIITQLPKGRVIYTLKIKDNFWNSLILNFYVSFNFCLDFLTEGRTKSVCLSIWRNKLVARGVGLYQNSNCLFLWNAASLATNLIFFCFLFMKKIIDLSGGQINDPSSGSCFSFLFLLAIPLSLSWTL